MDTEKQNVNIFNITAGYFEKVDNALSKQTKLKIVVALLIELYVLVTMSKVSK